MPKKRSIPASPLQDLPWPLSLEQDLANFLEMSEKRFKSDSSNSLPAFEALSSIAAYVWQKGESPTHALPMPWWVINALAAGYCKYRDSARSTTPMTLGEAYALEGGGQGNEPRIQRDARDLCDIRIASAIALGQGWIGCTSARDRGTCDNRRTIKRQDLEVRILRALQHELMRPELFEEFCAEYTREINRLRMEKTADIRAQEVDLAKVTRELDKLIDALMQGVPAHRVKERMIELEARRQDLQEQALRTKLPEPYLHPNMAITYRRKLSELAHAISGDSSTAKAAQEAIRALIESVIVTPAGETMTVDLVGELGGILSIASGQKEKGPAPSGEPSSAKLVAGIGFEPMTFRL